MYLMPLNRIQTCCFNHLYFTTHTKITQKGTARPLFFCHFVCLLQLSLTVLSSFPQLNFDLDRGVFPVVIQAVVDEGDGERPFLFCSPIQCVDPVGRSHFSPQSSGRRLFRTHGGCGSAHLAGLGPWDSSAGLSIFSLGPPCGRVWLSL